MTSEAEKELSLREREQSSLGVTTKMRLLIPNIAKKGVIWHLEWHLEVSICGLFQSHLFNYLFDFCLLSVTLNERPNVRRVLVFFSLNKRLNVVRLSFGLLLKIFLWISFGKTSGASL